MTTSRISFALLFLSILLLEGSALAQSTTPGFAINRFNPSERGSDWFVAESLDLRGKHRLALGAVADYSHNPLAVYDADTGDQAGAIIRHQFITHLGASFVVLDRLRFALNMPVLFYQSGDAFEVGGQTLKADGGSHIGDLRLGADVRIFGAYGGPATFALGAQVYLPTGSRDAFQSDGSTRFVPRALVAGEIGPFVYGGRFEVIIRKDSSFGDKDNGTSAFLGAAAGVRIKRLVLGPEVMASTVLQSDAFERTTTPAELLFGAHYFTRGVRFGLGAGTGLSRGFGAPDARVLGNLEWAPEPESKQAPPTPAVVDPDRDRDGVSNAVDACPDEAGVAHADPKKNGCPVSDRDHDQVPDELDACPVEAGVATGDPKTNGCPDADQDRIPDIEDACPNEPGVATSDPKTNGCPPPKDTDADGVMDPEDACPTAAGPKTADPKTNGCPVARLEQNEIRILEPVKFANNSDRLLPESEPVLTSVMDVLQAHPEITKLEVRGHTDSRGGAAANLGLSKRRAASVMRWLTAHGVAASRLGSAGLGQTRPIDTNDTDEGRQNNRRVEFRITATAAQ
ncbi:MAG TPA: OmpA family protein [Polyangiaceae bacterium]|nr:OmpA family protein [Polyangiaceae bacterium]